MLFCAAAGCPDDSAEKDHSKAADYENLHRLTSFRFRRRAAPATAYPMAFFEASVFTTPAWSLGCGHTIE